MGFELTKLGEQWCHFLSWGWLVGEQFGGSGVLFGATGETAEQRLVMKATSACWRRWSCRVGARSDDPYNEGSSLPAADREPPALGQAPTCSPLGRQTDLDFRRGLEAQRERVTCPRTHSR